MLERERRRRLAEVERQQREETERVLERERRKMAAIIAAGVQQETRRLTKEKEDDERRQRREAEEREQQQFDTLRQEGLGRDAAQQTVSQPGMQRQRLWLYAVGVAVLAGAGAGWHFFAADDVPLMAAAPSADLVWTPYRGERFDLSVEYPAALFGKPTPSDNTDGLTFPRNADGARLSIWGSYDIAEVGPYRSICPQPCPHETYRLSRDTIGASSGIAADVIYYVKCLKTQSSLPELHCFRLEYPESRRTIYDPVVSRMSERLR